MRYIYSRIGIFLKSVFRIVFGENKVRGVLVFILLAGLLTASTVMGVRSFVLRKNEPVDTEDPIESYDNVVEIIIGDDGEVVESDESSTDEEIK